MLPSAWVCREGAGRANSMNALDIALIALVAVPMMVGMLKGAVNVAIAFVGLWVSLVVARLFHAKLAVPFTGWLEDQRLAEVLAYGVLFLATFLAAGAAGWARFVTVQVFTTTRSASATPEVRAPRASNSWRMRSVSYWLALQPNV